MSMILDALKRSQSDARDSSSQPVIDQSYSSLTSSAPPLWLLLVGAALAMAIVLLLAVLVYLQWNPRELSTSAVQSEGAPVADGQHQSVASLPIQTSALKNAESELPEQDGEVKSPLREPASAADAALSSRAPARAISDLYANSSAIADIEEEPAFDSRAMTADDGEDSIDIAELVRRAQEAVGEKPISAHPTALLENLSQRQKNAIPTVIYSVHDWAGENSRVVLNGEAMQVGDRRGGFTVLEILADSVVVSWGGTEFRLRALNSWVNL